MTTEIAISETGITFPSDTGSFRIPHTFWVTSPYIFIDDLQAELSREAGLRGLEIMIDFDVATHEHIIHWRPRERSS